MKGKNKISILTDIAFWILGAAIYAAAVDMIIMPCGISMGGFTGIATALNHLTGIPSGTLLFVLNLPLLFLEFKKFGGGFVIKTFVAITFSSFFLDLWQVVLPVIQMDSTLAALFGGIISGFGLSLVLLRGATTGGVDVVARYINEKKPHLSIGKLLMLLDIAVIIFNAFVYRNIESALYSVITIYASGRVIDGVLYGGNQGKLAIIVSGIGNSVADNISRDLGRGVTIIPSFGGYKGAEKQTLLCAVPKYQVALLRRTVLKTDEQAFIILAEVGDIIGNGFKSNY